MWNEESIIIRHWNSKVWLCLHKSKICFPKYGGPCPQWLASPVISLSSNSMQPDAKVEKKCATSYLIDDMILKSILTFLPIISDSDEVKGHVILAKICYFWMILKICSTFYEIPSNAIKWIEMTMLSGKFFTFAGHENWVSHLNLQGAQYHRIESHLVQ